MPVYVDSLCNYGWKYGSSCHLVADTLEELHEFAAKIGMKRQWFQDDKRLPHYDLTAKRRSSALRYGAIEITFRQLAARMNPKWAEKMAE